MRTNVYWLYLGEISTESLLQNLTNTKEQFSPMRVSSIDAVRLSCPGGFTVSAQIEAPVYTDEERQAHNEAVHSRIALATTAEERTAALTNTSPSRLIALVLNPK
jgi:hypothetical protein